MSHHYAKSHLSPSTPQIRCTHRLCFSLVAFWALLSLCVWRATELWHLWKHGAYCLEFNSRMILNSGMFLLRLIPRRYFSEWYWHSKFQTLVLFQEQIFCCETTVYILFILYSDYRPAYSKCHRDESEPLIHFQIFTEVPFAELWHWAILEHPRSGRISYLQNDQLLVFSSKKGA